MEALFVGVTLGVIVPIYCHSILGIVLYLSEYGDNIKKPLLYKKVKLDSKFDTENNLFSLATPEIYQIIL